MRIKNDCARTPAGLLGSVRSALGWINAADLAGITHVLLVDEMPREVHGRRGGPPRSESERLDAYGFYVSERLGVGPFVALVVPSHYSLLPAAYRLTTAPTLLVAHTLAHEVAHHLVATRGYVFEPTERFRREEFEEEFADRYAAEVIKRMRRRLRYRVGWWALKDLANWQYVLGILDWRDKRYEEAAEHWRKSALLNPEVPDTIYWYHRAREMAGAAAANLPKTGEHATGKPV